MGKLISIYIALLWTALVLTGCTGLTLTLADLRVNASLPMSDEGSLLTNDEQ